MSSVVKRPPSPFRGHVALTKHAMEALKEQTIALERELEEERILKYRRMVAERDQLIASLQQKLAKKDKLLERQKVELVALQESTNADLLHSKRSMKAVNEQISELQEKLLELKKREHRAIEASTKAFKRIHELEAQVQDLENENVKLVAQLRTCEAQQIAYERELATLKAQLQAAQQRQAADSDERKHLMDQLAELHARNTQLVAERAQMQAEISAAVAKREAAQSHRRSALHSVLAQLDSLEHFSASPPPRAPVDLSVSQLLNRVSALTQSFGDGAAGVGTPGGRPAASSTSAATRQLFQEAQAQLQRAQQARAAEAEQGAG